MGALTRGLLAVLALLWLGAALAQPKYPTKPIRLIVPFPQGDSADHMARTMEPVLTERLRQPVIVENRPATAAAPASTRSPSPRPTATPWGWARGARWPRT